MTNTIALRTNMVAETMELNYKKGAVTTILDKASSIIRETEMANVVQIANRVLSGYGDYDDTNSQAYPAGSITQAWKSYEVKNDRGVEFSVDRIQNDESGNIAFKDALSITGQFQRENANPEIDATRFATMASTVGIQTTTAATLAANTIKAAIDTAIEKLDDAEVPEENRVLFISNACYNFLKNASGFTYNLKSDPTTGVVDTRVAEYEGMPVIKVPQSRFYTAIELLDGRTSGETAGGYRKSTVSGAVGTDINFMIVHQDAVIPIKTLEKFKYFSPDVNQKKDAHLWQGRLHHDIFVVQSKVKGIYLHKKNS